MAEVYAGFLTHADHQIGRLLDYLEYIDQLDNTIIFVVSDNGASGEGGPNGSVNENKFFNGIPDDLAANLAMIDELGGPRTYNHYPTGWAMAFNTPFKMWKRYSFNGGTCDPCIISWPAGITARGELRDQYHHAIDIVPDGARLPRHGAAGARSRGARQTPIQGVSMRYSFDAADTPTAQATQFYSMLGTRGDLARRLEGRHHAPGDQRVGPLRARHLGALPRRRPTASELHDLAAEQPGPAGRADRTVVLRGGRQPRLPARRPVRPRDHPDPAPAADPAPRPLRLPAGRGGGPRVTRGQPPEPLVHASARWSTCPTAAAQGVLFAHGSRFGGHALYVKDNRLHYVYNFVGSPNRRSSRTEDLPTGENLILSASFDKDGEDPPGSRTASLSLFHGDRKVGEGRIRTQPGMFALAGEGLTVGRDSGEPVTDDYPGEAPWRFTGGTLHRVAVDVSGDPYSTSSGKPPPCSPANEHDGTNRRAWRSSFGGGGSGSARDDLGAVLRARSPRGDHGDRRPGTSRDEGR